jgi:hypothetical protein
VLVWITDAQVGRIVFAAERLRIRLRADRDEAQGDAGLCEGCSELAQLLERFGKERSTYVAQPNDKSRRRDAECEDLRWNLVPDPNC